MMNYHPAPHPITTEKVSSSVEKTLVDLASINAVFPAELSLPATSYHDLLHQTARSGKQVRIDHFELAIPVQSHLDHVRMIARIADMVIQQHPLTHNGVDFVVGAIGYHDLPEIVTIDPPDFTSAALQSHLPKSLMSLSRKEATDFVRESFPSHLRAHFETTMDGLDQRSGEAYKVFRFADKIEPITAIWRYLRCYHDSVDPERFIVAMEDFFTNPQVATLCFDDEQREAARFLQSMDNAREYYRTGSGAFSKETAGNLTYRLITEVINRFDMDVVPAT